MLYSDLSSISIPAPWASGRTVETIHPVRDNYKFKETVSFPGARHLYLKFDPRCSSQYDYDKVIMTVLYSLISLYIRLSIYYLFVHFFIYLGLYICWRLDHVTKNSRIWR